MIRNYLWINAILTPFRQSSDSPTVRRRVYCACAHACVISEAAAYAFSFVAQASSPTLRRARIIRCIVALLRPFGSRLHRRAADRLFGGALTAMNCGRHATWTAIDWTGPVRLDSAQLPGRGGYISIGYSVAVCRSVGRSVGHNVEWLHHARRHARAAAVSGKRLRPTERMSH